MRRSLIVLSVAVLACASGTAADAYQWPTAPTTTQFGTRHNDEAFAVSENVVGGVTQRSGDKDGFLRYFGLHGHTKWRVRIATASDDRVVAVAQVFGRLFVAGTTEGALGDGSNAGGTDVFVRAYSTDGRLRWSQQFGTAVDDVATAIGAGESPGLTVAGWTDGDLAGASAGGDDAFAIHLSRRGIVQWSKQIGTVGDDRALCIDPVRPELICGSTTGSMPGASSAGGVDAFVVRLSQTDGGVDWLRQLGTPADDVPAGVGTFWSNEIVVGGSTGGTFPGATSNGGRDAFVATYYSGLPYPNLGDVQQFGTPGDEQVTGFWTRAFWFIGGTTTGTFPGQTSTGGVDGWASMLDMPLYENRSAGTVWTQQFGTAADDQVDGLSGPYSSGEMADYTYAVGGTSGTFPGERSAGKRDAFWSLRFEPSDRLAQDVLLRGLAVAQAFRDDNTGAYDGFDQVDATQMSPSYVWLKDPAEPHGPQEMTIAHAVGTTVRLVSYSKSGTYYCIEETGGAVSYGHGPAYDPDSCSGGW
jgi:hypothetical protein